MARKYYYTDEVADILGVSTDVVREMLQNGDLIGHKWAGRWYINVDQPCLKKNSDTRLVKDVEHVDLILDNIDSAVSSIYIATANFKNVYLYGDNLVSILNKKVEEGVEIKVICSKLHHQSIDMDFEVIECQRNHMKMFIFDEEKLYVGSANLTSAAITDRGNSTKTNNHEAGIFTVDEDIVSDALEHFNAVFDISDCDTCKIKSCSFKE